MSSPCGIAGDILPTVFWEMRSPSKKYDYHKILIKIFFVFFLLYPISLDDRATTTVSAGSVRLAKAEKNNSTSYIAGEWHGNTIQGS